MAVRKVPSNNEKAQPKGADPTDLTQGMPATKAKSNPTTPKDIENRVESDERSKGESKDKRHPKPGHNRKSPHFFADDPTFVPSEDPYFTDRGESLNNRSLSSVSPPLRAGVRIPQITELQIIRQVEITGGTQVSLTWLSDPIGEIYKPSYAIYGCAGTTFTWADGQTSLDLSQTNSAAVLLGTCSYPPITVTIPGYLQQRMTIFVVTRLLNGYQTEFDESPSVSVQANPVNTLWFRPTTDFEILPQWLGGINRVWVVADATAAAMAVTLPNTSQVCDGFQVLVKKIDAGANAVTVTAKTGQLIDGAGTNVLAAQWDVVDLYADYAASLWRVA